MLSNLLESRRAKSRKTGGTVFSVLVHTAVIGFAIQATLNAGQPMKIHTDAIAVFVPKQPDPPPAPKVPQPVAQAPVPFGGPVLTAPIEIPMSIPAIDLAAPLTNADDYRARGVPGGRSDGIEGLPAPRGDGAMTSEQVEKPVAVAPGSKRPDYPEMLRSSGVTGIVLATFEVDTTGRAVAATFKVVSATHPLFAEAVRKALPGMRFVPAEYGGKKVRQVVEQSFSFSFDK